MKKIVAALLIFPFCVSLVFAARDPVQSTIKGVMKVLSDQRDAWNRGDLKAFMDGYWRSDGVTFVSDGTVRRGWGTVYRRYVKTYGQNKGSMGHLSFSRIVVIPLGDAAALAYGRWDLVMNNGKKIGGIFSLVFRRFGDGWKIIHDHTSRDGG